MPITKPLARRRTKQLFLQKRPATATSSLSSSPALSSKKSRTRAKKPLFAHVPPPPQPKSPPPSEFSAPPAASESASRLPPSAVPPSPPPSHPRATAEPAFAPASPYPHTPPPAPAPVTQDIAFSPPPASPLTPASEIDSLKHLIEQTSARLEELETERIEIQSQTSPPSQDPEEYNGIDTASQQHQIYDVQFQKLEKENQKLHRQLELVKTEFAEEKSQLEKTIREMQAELRRTAPIQDSKFFSISKDLREAVKAIESLNDPDFIPETVDPPLVVAASVSDAPAPAATVPEPKKISVSPPKPEPKPTSAKTPSAKEKKLLITGGAIISLLSVGGLASWKIASKPQVNQELVDAYLAQQGQVQGIQSDTIAAQNKNIPTDKFQEIPFDQTQWQTFEDPILGLQIKYPAGLVEKLATGSNITFLRKEGYLFKVQIYSTELTSEEFWAQQKSSINYTAIPTQLAGKNALHLRLEDQIEFPGDRYLIHNQGKLYDLWIATPSQQFSSDDIQRAEFMLKSFRIL